MKIYIGADHAGFELKGALVDHLKSKNIEVEDVGAHTYDKDDDYPDFIIACAQKVASDSGSLGIVIGGSGQGEAMAANKVKGVRAALYYGKDLDIIKLSKEHNNANVISFGARFLSEDEAKEALDLWLETNFSGDDRHSRRLDKISKFEGDSK